MAQGGASDRRRRRRLEESRLDLEIALRDEWTRYAKAIRPLVRNLRDVREQITYLDWLRDTEAT